MAVHKLRLGASTLLMAALSACSPGSGDPPRASGQPTPVQGGSSSTSLGQSGTMSGSSTSGMGQMDHAQMMEHCRAMMQGGTSAHSGTMGGMNANQMMAHCRSMMGQQGQPGTPATR